MGGITVWIKNRFLAGRCLKGIQITARDIPLKPIKQADISSDIQHFVETGCYLGYIRCTHMHRRFGGHNRPSLSGPSIPCPRVETRDRHEAPLPVKTETGVLKRKGGRITGILASYIELGEIPPELNTQIRQSGSVPCRDIKGRFEQDRDQVVFIFLGDIVFV